MTNRGDSIIKIYRTKNYDEMSRTAANLISAQIILKPDCVLGLATAYLIITIIFVCYFLYLIIK